jgi:hypothetical protein
LHDNLGLELAPHDLAHIIQLMDQRHCPSVLALARSLDHWSTSELGDKDEAPLVVRQISDNAAFGSSLPAGYVDGHRTWAWSRLASSVAIDLAKV